MSYSIVVNLRAPAEELAACIWRSLWLVTVDTERMTVRWFGETPVSWQRPRNVARPARLPSSWARAVVGLVSGFKVGP